MALTVVIRTYIAEAVTCAMTVHTTQHTSPLQVLPTHFGTPKCGNKGVSLQQRDVPLTSLVPFAYAVFLFQISNPLLKGGFLLF